jgi:hypothetical protein
MHAALPVIFFLPSIDANCMQRREEGVPEILYVKKEWTKIRVHPESIHFT